MSAFDDLKDLASEDIEKANTARYPSGTRAHYGFAKPPRKHADSFTHGRIRHRSRLHHTNLRRTAGKIKSVAAKKSIEGVMSESKLDKLQDLAKGFDYPNMA